MQYWKEAVLCFALVSGLNESPTELVRTRVSCNLQPPPIYSEKLIFELLIL